MAYIQTYGGGFNQSADGNLSPYEAPGTAPKLNWQGGDQQPQLDQDPYGLGGGNTPSPAGGGAPPPFNPFNPASHALGAVNNQMSQALQFVNNLPPGTKPTTAPTTPPKSPFSYQQNPTGTDMIGGTQGLNSRNFATLDSANALAKQLGGNVVATNYEDAMRSPEYNIDFGRGSALNAGLLQQRYDTSDPNRDKFWDSEYWRNKALEDELRYNSSPMEDDIRNDRSGQMGQILKDVPGGFQSFKPGGSAGSFSNASTWNTTGPSGSQFAPGGPQAGQLNSAGNPFGAQDWMSRLPGGAGGGAGGGGNQFVPGGQFGGRGSGGIGGGNNGGGVPPGTGGFTPPPPGTRPFGGPQDGIGRGSGGWGGGQQGGGFNPFGGFGGGGMQMPYGNLGGFAQLMNSVNQMRNGMGYSPQRRPQLRGMGSGFGGQSYGNGYYYPQMSSGYGRGYY